MTALFISSVMFAPAVLGLCVAMFGTEKRAA